MQTRTTLMRHLNDVHDRRDGTAEDTAVLREELTELPHAYLVERVIAMQRRNNNYWRKIHALGKVIAHVESRLRRSRRKAAVLHRLHDHKKPEDATQIISAGAHLRGGV